MHAKPASTKRQRWDRTMPTLPSVLNRHTSLAPNVFVFRIVIVSFHLSGGAGEEIETRRSSCIIPLYTCGYIYVVSRASYALGAPNDLPVEVIVL